MQQVAKVYDEFKFNIADHLQPKKPAIRKMWNLKGQDVRLFVVHRIYHECPGGVQLNYDCRIVHADGTMSTQLVQFNEVELEEYGHGEQVLTQVKEVPSA